MSYSRTRLLCDLEKLKSDARDIYKENNGTGLQSTSYALKQIVLMLDEVIAIERTKGKKDDRTDNPLLDKGFDGADFDRSGEPLYT